MAKKKIKIDPEQLNPKHGVTVRMLIAWLAFQEPDAHVFVGIVDDDHPAGGVITRAQLALTLTSLDLLPGTPEGSIEIVGHEQISGYTSLVDEDDG